MLAEGGYEAMTLRTLARRAGVSPGAVYKHFPNKAAIVMALYERLSLGFAETAHLPSGSWRLRFEAALDGSLGALAPHRDALAGLVSVLVGDPTQGVLAPETRAARHRVESVFQAAALGASPRPPQPEALGRALYAIHLGVILFWLLDKSPGQRATADLRALLRRGAAPVALALRLPGAGRVIQQVAGILEDGILT